MSNEVSQKLLAERYHGDESKKDIHEKDREYLARSRKAARFCSDFEGWVRIKCDDGEKPFGIDEIARKVYEEVRKAL